MLDNINQCKASTSLYKKRKQEKLLDKYKAKKRQKISIQDNYETKQVQVKINTRQIQSKYNTIKDRMIRRTHTDVSNNK